MGNPYTSVTVTSYNSNPPPDDGSQIPSNRVTWATHKTKIGDPLKAAIESINTNVNSAVAKLVGGAGVVSTATSYGVGAGDQGKLIKITAAGTITTPDATVVGEPFVFGLLNVHTSAITLDGSGSQTVNGSPSIEVAPGDGYLIWTDGANWFVIGRKTGTLPRGYIDGCTLANGTDATNDINVAAGACRDSTSSVDITVAAMAGKQLDANWAPGAAAGMRNSAAGITDATYHIYAVSKADGTQDIYAHTSTVVATVITALQAETGGANYLYARRIGSIMRVSGAIKGFIQTGDVFDFTSPILDISSTNPGTSAVSRTLSVPSGIIVAARMNVYVASTSSGNVYCYLSPLDCADMAPSTSAAPLASIGSEISASPPTKIMGQVVVRTNTSAAIRSRLSASAASDVLLISSLGYTDLRGKA